MIIAWITRIRYLAADFVFPFCCRVVGTQCAEREGRNDPMFVGEDR